jgi:hypothetical protein
MYGRKNTKNIGNVPVLPTNETRIRCAECGKPLRIRLGGSLKWATVNEEQVFARDCDGTWKYDSYGNLCTQRCAVRFANRAFKAGFR